MVSNEISDSKDYESNYQYDEEDINYGISYEDEPAVPLEFNAFIEKNKSDSQSFKFYVIAFASVLVAIGILLNIIFTLVVLCRKRKRQTSTTIIMLTMSIAYIILLAFYTLKLTIYFEGDNITKFHMYDTIDNWTYGQFLCRLTSGLPIFVKLIIRLSMFCIALKRFINIFDCDCSEGIRSEDEQDMLEDHDESKHDYGMQFRSTPKSSFKESKKNSKSFKLRCFAKLFEWPLILLLILSIWLTSFVVTLPLFASYKLNEPSGTLISNPICNSIFKFPEDLSAVQSMYFGYLIFGLVIPCGLVLACLVLLFIFQNCLTNTSMRGHSKSLSPKQKSEVHSSTNSSSSSSTSFTEISSNYHQQSCGRSKGNNMLLWTTLTFHLLTSLPQEINRYLQLKTDFNDENVLDEYLTSSLTDPITKARTYYALQLLYLSESAIVPVFFLLFAICSLRRSRPTRSSSDADLKKKCSCSPFAECTIFKMMGNLFYDSELSESRKKGSFLKIYKDSTAEHKAPPSAFLTTDQISEGSESESEKFPQITESEYQQKCNNNVMHIIQHPSWRINIKQQAMNNSKNNQDTSNLNSVQLPIYVNQS